MNVRFARFGCVFVRVKGPGREYSLVVGGRATVASRPTAEVRLIGVPSGLPSFTNERRR